MKEQLVTFEVAKLAKEKGFYWIESDNKWYDNVGHPEVSSQGYHQEINSYRTSIPTQSLLQKWLREEHDIEVYSYSYTVRGGDKGKKFGDYIYVVNPLHGGIVLMGDSKKGKYQFYEKALEKGLYEALKLI